MSNTHNREERWLRFLLRTVEIWLSSCRPALDVHPLSKELISQDKQFIVALWHSALIYCLFHFRSYPAAIMVSGSKDGEWVARALELWGQHPVRGSKLKGGLLAIREMTKLLKEEKINAGIVADGSKGPPCIAQKGPIVLARDTGFPLIPVGVSARPAYHFNSWDRLMLPLPFSRVSVVYGEPFYVEENTRGPRMEEARLHLEKELIKASVRAKRLARSKG